MVNEKRLIDAMPLVTKISRRVRGMSIPQDIYDGVLECIADAPTVDAVEVVQIERAKQEILQRMDNFIVSYKDISQSHDDFWGGKAEAMEVARCLVNAALNELCSNCGAKMDGGNEDG